MHGYFALIGWGGTTPGHRPATRLAWMGERQIQTWNGRDWIPCHKTREEITIYRRWDREPVATQVRRAKRALKPIA